MSKVQHAIKKAIQLCGGKQIKLARKAGVSQNAVSKLESGASKRATLDTAQKLSAAVGNQIPFTDFMGAELIEVACQPAGEAADNDSIANHHKKSDSPHSASDTRAGAVLAAGHDSCGVCEPGREPVSYFADSDREEK